MLIAVVRKWTLIGLVLVSGPALADKRCVILKQERLFVCGATVISRLPPYPDCPPAFDRVWKQGGFDTRAAVRPNKTCVLHTETNEYVCDQNGCGHWDGTIPQEDIEKR